ncbi:2-phytyl-1,4-naphtoquinone methyltransferase [Chloropicon primus]|nr:2-phytyl-1,4-naphtoquinone methyltransferase [Chloropicon primus]
MSDGERCRCWRRRAVETTDDSSWRMTITEEALQGKGEGKSKGREKIFTNISPVYDVLNDALSLGLHRLWKRRVVSLTECKRGDKALDVCCGSGDLAFLLAKKVGASGEVSALDFSANMLSYALQRSVAKSLFQYTYFDEKPRDDGGGDEGGSGTIRWIHGDALDLPFEDCSFDCVTIGYGLRNVEDRAKCLREVHRVLKPNKRAVILDFNSPKEEGPPAARGNTRRRAGIINRFRNFCLDAFVVPAATLCGLREEYAYLKPSIADYPDGSTLVTLSMEDARFTQAEFQEIAGGLMGALVLRK